jgi:hypothetical protein
MDSEPCYPEVGFGEVSISSFSSGKAGRLGNDNVLNHSLSG